MKDTKSNEFEKIASEQPNENRFLEIWQFVKANKKWWLIPIIALLIMFGVLIYLSGTAAAPFIYTLF